MAHPKWHDLADRMRAIGVYEERLLTPKRLSSQFFAGRTVLYPRAHKNRLPEGPIQGHIARRKTAHENWQEICQIYVDAQLRANGAMRNMLYELIARAPPQIRLFAITRVESVASALSECCFTPVSGATMPRVREWANTTGLGERLPETALSDARPSCEGGHRVLFIR